MVKLSNRTVALLNVSRAMTAVYIVIHHVALSRGWTSGPGFVFRFGAEGVMVFFLLSGFVIFANEKDRAADLGGYALRRFRRIYPCLVIAMAVSAVVAGFNGTFQQDFHISEFIGTLLALQDISSIKPGVIVDPFMGNAPLWSLSYEILFYLFFPFVLMAWKRRPLATTHAIGAISVASYVLFSLYPNHLSLVVSYYLIWWTGAMAAHAYLEGHRSITALKAVLTWLCILIGVAAVVAFAEGYHGVGLHPFFELRHFSVSLVFVIVFFGPVGNLAARLASRISAPAAALASISYGLYVFHLPLVVKAQWASSTTGLLFMLLVLIVVAFLADRTLNTVLSGRWRSGSHALRPTPPGALLKKQSYMS